MKPIYIKLNFLDMKLLLKADTQPTPNLQSILIIVQRRASVMASKDLQERQKWVNIINHYQSHKLQSATNNLLSTAKIRSFFSGCMNQYNEEHTACHYIQTDQIHYKRQVFYVFTNRIIKHSSKFYFEERSDFTELS